MTTQQQETEAQPQAAEFAAFLVGHLNGRVHQDLSAEMHELLQAVAAHGKKGSLVIKVLVEPSKGHVEGDPLSISVESELKAPKSVPPASIYWVDSEGNAVRQDPRQIALDFRTAPATTEYKDA
ncbi:MULTISPECIES: hypothetical protein [unclassified Streptomyces]|uniref:hypothetical protein n=1 Tax=unclassified Streptomyces TaxID=2593676 RepID=UPI0036E27429